MSAKSRFLNSSTFRRDGLAKVRGPLRFTNDLEVPGMHVGRIVRSPYAFADIRGFDVDEAEKLGAVVLTPDDVP